MASNPSFERGFTIAEMLVSIGIISVIFAIVILNQGTFVDTFSLGSNASDLELQIRQAQIYGTSVREFAASSNEFSDAYGISVNIGAGGGNSFYISFADRGSRNGFYDGGATCITGGSSECLQRYNFTKNITVSTVCAMFANGSEDCYPNVGRVDISFLRPDPEARISFFDASGVPVSESGATGVRIELASPLNKKKSIEVYKSGQVSVVSS